MTAVDGSEVALRKAAKLAQEAHVGLTRVRCDIRSIRDFEWFRVGG